MPISATSTLPEGMRERTFALRSLPGGELIKFGRNTELPASSYTFPAIDSTTETFRRPTSHSTSFGSTSLTPDFFEAQVGALEPNSTVKMDALARAWNLPNYSRLHGERHEMYYVLGGRGRLMYGKPGRIGFTYHGFKTSYHEAILRFTVSDPFFYSSDVLEASQTISLQSNHSTTNDIAFVNTPRTEAPAPASIKLSGKAERVTVYSEGRVLLVVNKLAGEFNLVNFPGLSATSYTSSGPNPVSSSGADMIGIETPPLRSCIVRPTDTKISVRVEAGTAAANVECSVKWRNAYASP